MATATAPPPEGAQARRLTELVLRVRELGIVVALAALILVTAILEPRFVEADSLRNLALNASIFVVLAADGVAVLMVSSELPEVLGMADRVLVMHEGRLTADIPATDADEESVMLAATGQR